jgi:hypothetical protein
LPHKLVLLVHNLALLRWNAFIHAFIPFLEPGHDLSVDTLAVSWAPVSHTYIFTEEIAELLGTVLVDPHGHVRRLPVQPRSVVVDFTFKAV